MTDAARTPRWPVGTAGALMFALGLMIAYKAVAFGLGGAVAQALGIDPRNVYRASPASFLALTVSAVLTISLVLVLGMRRLGRVEFRQAGWRAFQLRDLALGVAGLAVCLAMMLGTAWLFHISKHIVRSVASFNLQQRAFFLLLGAFAAFTEETIFRGILQPTLQRKLGRWAGLALTALIFALWHFRFRPLPLINLTGMGLVYGALRERTGSLWAPAIAHALVWAIMGST